jgi:hypothetical protein
MSNITIGTGAKKETVYDGPSPQPRQSSSSLSAPAAGTVYGGMAPGTNGGTVYGGPPAGGTVYNGPGGGGTVYNPARQKPAAPVDVTNTGAAKGGAIFFIIAACSALNSVLIFAQAPFVLALGLAITRVRISGDLAPVLALNAIVLGLFVAVGIFAIKGSKAAFIIGLVLYGGDTVLLLTSGDAALHIPSIVVHGVFIFSIIKAFRQLEA